MKDCSQLAHQQVGMKPKTNSTQVKRSNIIQKPGWKSKVPNFYAS